MGVKRSKTVPERQRAADSSHGLHTIARCHSHAQRRELGSYGDGVLLDQGLWIMHLHHQMRPCTGDRTAT